MVKGIKYFPDLRQFCDYDCGANAILAILEYYGIDVNEEKIMKIAGTTRKYGTLIEGLKNVAKKFGLKYKVTEKNIDFVKSELDKKHPVMINLQAWLKKKPKNWKKVHKYGHWVIAKFYDKKNIYFEDPAIIGTDYLSFSELEKRWHDIDARKKKNKIYVGISFYGKKPKYNSKKFRHMN